MTDKVTIQAGTDADGNSSVTATMIDEAGNPLDTIIYSATNPKDQYSTYTIADGLTVTRYGKLCILKANNMQGFKFGIATLDTDGTYKYNKDTSAFVEIGFTLPAEYRPRNSNEFFYRSFAWHDSTVQDSSTYWFSLAIKGNNNTSDDGKIYARLERNIDYKNGVGSRNNISFTLPYWVE